MEPCASCDARALSACNAIGDGDLTRLAAAMVVVEVAAGQVFIEEGERAEAFFNITQGTAKLYKLLPDGRRQITGFAVVGDFLGLAVSETYAFTAEAIEPVRLCRFSRPKLRALLDDFPVMERRLLEKAGDQLLAAQEQMLLLGRKTAREKVASFLAGRRRRSEARDASGEELDLPMTRADMADYLGLTVETVSRTLTQLQLDRIIALPSKSAVVVQDRKRLQELAAGL